MFIYLIVNHETGKYYVGQHKGNNLKKYLQQKFSAARYNEGKGGSYLFASMRAHPFPHLWSIHALRSGIQTREELDETERDFIKFLRSQDPEYGYNICRGGEGFTGLHSEGFKQRISKTTTEMWKRPEIRQIIISKNTGQKRSQETIDNLTRARRARMKGKSPCRIEECNKAVEAYGLCNSHYQRMYKYGNPLAGNPTGVKGPLPGAYQCSEETRAKLSEIAVKGFSKHIVAFSKNWMRKPKSPCSVADCGRFVKARGLCNTHLQRLYRQGG